MNVVKRVMTGKNMMLRKTKMKKTLLIILPLLLILGCSKPVDRSTLINKDGLMYLPDSDSPYSGEVFLFRRIKTKEGLFKRIKVGDETYKDGKIEGLVTLWFENGQKWEEGNYKDGKIEGLYTTWYENGQKKEETNYKDGKKDGLYNSWYSDGKKWEEGNYKDGKKDGLWTYVFMNWKYTYKDGKLISYKKGYDPVVKVPNYDSLITILKSQKSNDL